MNGDEFGLLRAFSVVADERSFTRAAGKLGVSPSALSHAIRKLEERVGVRLLARTTRSVAPTQAGLSLLERVRPALTEIETSLDDLALTRDRPAGSLRLLASKMALRLVLAPKLIAFAQAHPDVALEIVSDSSSVDLVAAEFDAGVHVGEYIEQDMISVRVSPDQRAAIVGSPGYLASRPVPKSPRDLTRHRCIGYRMGRGIYRWEFEKRGRSLSVNVPWSMTVDDLDLLTSAAVHGLGLAYLFEDSAAKHLASGSLVRVLEDWCPPFPGYFLYYPHARQKSAALAALVTALRMP